MYEVYIDDRLLYYEGDEELVLLDSELEESMNSAPVLTLEVPAINPEYDNLHLRNTMIQVRKDGKERFYGEIVEIKKDENNTKQVTVVGELAFLFASIQPQAEYHDLSPRQMLETWLAIHNSQVEDRKKFYTGIVTVHDTNDSLYRYTNHENTLDAIREKLIERLGGFLRVRKADGKRYLDWVTLADYGKRCVQKIKFGVNMLEYSETVIAEELYTAVIPLGGRLEESPIEALEAYTDITTVNGGKDYLYSPEAVERFGWSRCVVKWDDVYVPSILKEKGEEWLRDNQFAQVSLELTALDLSVLGVKNADEICLGDEVNAVAAVYGMDRWFPVFALTTYLQRPEDNKLTLGDTEARDYIGQQKDTEQTFSQELERTKETSGFLKSAIDNATQMMTGSKGGYRITEFDSDGLFLRDLYMNAPTKESATDIMQIGPRGIGFSRTGFNGPYKSAWTIDGVLLGEFIKADSIQAQSLSTEYKESVQQKITDGDDGLKKWASSEITTSIKAAEGRISLSVTEQRKYIDGIKETLSGELKVTSDAVAAEVKRSTASEEKLSASIKVTADGIASKVAKGEFSSYLEQYYDKVLFKFNSDSRYVQINSGEIGIYDGAISDSKKRATFNQSGNHFYRDGYYIGNIGTNHWKNEESKKGLEFDMEYNGAYMTWAWRESETSDRYTAKWTYTSRGAGYYAADMLHAGCDIDMHYFAIKNISAGGYSAFNGVIPFIVSIEDTGNGGMQWMYSNLHVYDGIIAGYWN